MSTINPVTALAAAEQTLIAAVNGTADALDAIGTTSLDAAMERLRQSAANARRRLCEAKSDLFACVADVLGEMGDFASVIVPPAPVAAALPAPVVQEPVQEPASIEPTCEPSAEEIAPPEAVPAFQTSHSALTVADDDTVTIPAPETAETSHSETVIATAANAPVEEERAGRKPSRSGGTRRGKRS